MGEGHISALFSTMQCPMCLYKYKWCVSMMAACQSLAGQWRGIHEVGDVEQIESSVGRSKTVPEAVIHHHQQTLVGHVREVMP